MERSDQMIRKSELVLSTLCGFFFGIVLGFLISPIKKGIEIRNNSGNTTTYGCKADDGEDWEE